MKTVKEIKALSKKAYNNYSDKEQMLKDRNIFIYGYKIAQLDMLKFKKAYNILRYYFDSISDEKQLKVNKQLEKLGL